MAFKAVISDLDGVVVDTVPVHFKAWKKMFGEYGVDFTFDMYKQKVDGIPRNDGARAILTDLSPDELTKAATRKQDYFLEFLNKEEIPRYDSTINLFWDLKEAGIQVAVISSSKNCPDILKRIGIYDRLDAVVSGFDITKGKPDPQIFLMAAERVGAKPDECVVFEDAVLGVEAAKNGHMRCIGIDRYNEPDRLAKADLVVSDLSEVDVATIKSLF